MEAVSRMLSELVEVRVEAEELAEKVAGRSRQMSEVEMCGPKHAFASAGPT